MYTYIYCRCKNCAAQIVLEERGGSNTNLFRRPARPRAGREACPSLSGYFWPSVTAMEAVTSFVVPTELSA